MSLINKGKKFIPCFHLNSFHFFKNLLNNFELNISSLNKSFFCSKFYKKSYNLNLIENIDKSTDLSLIDSFELVNLNNIKHDSLIHKIFRSNNKKNEKNWIQNELVDYQLSVYEYFSKNNIEFDKLLSNISKEEYFILTRFLTNKPFKIVECDKNVGSAVISHDLYNKLCLKNLNSPDFEIIKNDPLELINSEIKHKLDHLLSTNDISLKMRDFLIMDLSKLGRYRLLMKIHKAKFGTRPIINSKSHPTENLSWLLDCLIRPLIILTESYIQDSQNLLQKTKNKKFPFNCKIYSCDFEGLYSNIDLTHALFIIYDFMKDKINSKNLNHKAFFIILKLVFDNNYFTYGKKFYRQVTGIAMGTKCGPSIANIYLYILEKNFLQIHKPLHYSRFIDDIFIITLNEFDISLLPSYFHNLKLNIETNNNRVNFLDLSISLNKLNNTLNFSLYTKPTNTFQQLLCTSNHQKNIIENNPFGSYLRIRRICSYSHDFIHYALILTNQLITRGYTRKKLFKFYNTVLSLERDKLLEYKPKKQLDFNNCILLRMNFDLNYVEIQKELRLVFKKCFKDHPLLSCYKLKILNKTQTNFGSLTINNLKPDNLIINNLGSKKCNIYNCKVCPVLMESCFVKLNNFYLPIDLNTNCNSKFIVYAINCTFCKDVFYIGETERKASIRIKEHLRDINNFTPYIQYNSVVSYHFNLLNHDKNKHFKFYIIQNNLNEKKIRQDFENTTIHLFLKLGLKVINDPIKIRGLYNFGEKI